MNVMIIATMGCRHCKSFSKELDDIGIEHHVVYAEDEPSLCQSLAIRHSPNLVIDGKVAYRRQPSETELRNLFNKINIQNQRT